MSYNALSLKEFNLVGFDGLLVCACMKRGGGEEEMAASNKTRWKQLMLAEALRFLNSKFLRISLEHNHLLHNIFLTQKIYKHMYVWLALSFVGPLLWVSKSKNSPAFKTGTFPNSAVGFNWICFDPHLLPMEGLFSL